MKKIRVYTLLSIFIVVLAIAIVVLLNPLRRSTERIKEDILQLTPIGMSMEDVIKTIENNENWVIRYISDKHGYSILGGRPGEPSTNENSDTIIGGKSIRTLIGEYRNIITIYVIVYWGFDENSKLIDLHVRKDGDSL